jgi:hypothetical protein
VGLVLYICACYIGLNASAAAIESPKGGEYMLSRDCDGCTQMQVCRERYKQVAKDEKVYCPDGTAHLVDQNN